MSYYSKALKNVFFNWVILFVNIVVSFFLAPFVVHKLGNTYYGIWVIMMQLTGYLYLMDFGVRESLVRFISKYHATENQTDIDNVIKAGLILYSGIGLICFLLTFLFSFAAPYVFNLAESTIETTRIVVLLTGMNVTQALVFNVFSGIIMGMQRTDLTTKAGVLFVFIRLFLIVYFLNRGYGIIALGAIQLGVNLGLNWVSYIISRKLLSFNILSARPDRHVYRSIINYGSIVLLNNVCEKIILYTDTILIGIFLAPASVTFFAIAGNLVQYVKRMVSSLARVINPLTSELETRNETERIRTVLLLGSKFSLLVALPPCITFLIMGRRFISLWMGPEYMDLAGDVLMVLAVNQIFSTPHYTYNNIFYGTSRHHIIAICRLFEAVCNLTLSLLLIRTFGIVGVAYGTVVPHIVVTAFVLPYLVTKQVGIRLYDLYTISYLRPAIAAIPFGIAMYFVNRYYPVDSLLMFFAEILLLLPIYFLSAWFIAINQEERNAYKARYFSRFFAFSK